MTETRTLDSPPPMPLLYARAAAPLVPGASRLPFLGGGGGELPALELLLPEAVADPREVARYCRVCGFRLRDELPPTYPHILAFGLHMALITDARFPFGAVGLVHIANRIVQRRPVRVGEPLELRVRAEGLEPHPRGRQFQLVTEARAGGELVWSEQGTILRRGGGSGEGEGAPGSGAGGSEPDPGPERRAEWRLGGDLGRRYASVSGDRNPIHLHPLTARLLGFPRPIAHGMWTMARCLAALEGNLPDRLETEVRFRRPILLPTTVAFGSELRDGRVRFAVRGARDGTPHLDGSAGEPGP